MQNMCFKNISRRGISFKTLTSIDFSSVSFMVASYEQEYVANNRRSAEKSDGELLF